VRLGALYTVRVLGPGIACRAGGGLGSDFITVLIFTFDGEERKTGDNRTAVVW